MTHKVHPTMFRIPYIGDWKSRWLQLKKTKEFLEEDMYIREFIKEKLQKALLESVEIERFAKQTKIIINSARPGIIIGRGGSGVEELKESLERFLARKIKNRERGGLRIEIHEVKNPDASAAIMARAIADQIERRLPFRRVIKMTLEKISAGKGVEGVKIQVSGRLGGGEIARREWLAKGRLPLVSIRADIDYAHAEAQCTYGKIGVKVWIYKGDKFQEK